MNIIIDPEFRDKIPKLTESEFQQLEENIVSAGAVLNPLILWGNTMIDGHNRWQIIQKHPGITYETKQIDFPDRYAAIVWICKNQLGRRNLTNEQKTYLIGKQYEAEKMTKGINNQYAQTKSEKAHCELFQNGDGNRTAKKIAVEHGIGRETVKRAEQFAKGVDEAEKISPGIKEEILAGNCKVPKTQIAAVAKLPEEEKPEAVMNIKTGTVTHKKPPAHKQDDPTDAMISKVVADMYNANKIVERNVDDLVEEIQANFRNCINGVKDRIGDYESVLNEIEARQKVIAALSEAEAAIKELEVLCHA